MSHASDAFRRAVLEAQSVRQDYFNNQLPKVLRVSSPPSIRDLMALADPPLLFFSQQLKQCADEVDLGTQYHMSRYAYLYETMVLQEGTTLTPVDGLDGEYAVPLFDATRSQG